MVDNEYEQLHSIQMKIDLSNIESVFLDMDGTILDLHFDNYFWLTHLPKVYSSKNRISNDEALQILQPIFEKHQATLNWYCVNFWSDELSIDIMKHKTEVAQKIGYRPQAQAFIEHCQKQVKDFRLITNGHREVLNLKNKYTELEKHFSALVCSHELNAPKEDIEFWQNLQKQKSFDPKTTLFIDDSEAVLDTANEYGIQHLYSIAKPDSTKQRETISKYQMLETFF